MRVEGNAVVERASNIDSQVLDAQLAVVVCAVLRKGEAGGGHRAWGLMAEMTLEQACPLKCWRMVGGIIGLDFPGLPAKGVLADSVSVACVRPGP